MAEDRKHISIYLPEDSPRLAHYRKWAQENGYVTKTGKINLSALLRAAADALTKYRDQ